MKTKLLALIFIVALSPSAVPADTHYAIIVSETTNADPNWQKVVDALAKKHNSTAITTWKTSVKEVLPWLQNKHPRYTCFVTQPSETTRQLVADVHKMTRRIDEDPYADTLWGILTGYNAENALSIAQHNQPLTVRKTASGTEVALEMCSQGIWYDELVKNKTVSRSPDGEIKQTTGPADTTKALAETLTDYHADLFVTSGHATERDWQIGYSYRNGTFRSKAGQMFGVTVDRERFEITSTNPKVYLPIGNCLMGHIDGPDAMALAWMNSLGVKQMIGYTVVTWYGYGGWGVLDYFVEQPGRYTLAEAFHVNHHALIHRIQSNFGDVVSADFAVGSRAVPQVSPNESGKQAGLSPMDARGLLWDRDTVVFYGDPAWEARMDSKPKAYDQELSVDGNQYKLTITPRRGEKSFEPINTNGAQRGWRPIVALLPHRIGKASVISGEDLNPTIADDFIIVPNPRSCDPTQKYEIVFKANRK